MLVQTKAFTNKVKTLNISSQLTHLYLTVDFRNEWLETSDFKPIITEVYEYFWDHKTRGDFKAENDDHHQTVGLSALQATASTSSFITFHWSRPCDR